MPGSSFTKRYVIARESNVVRVDFARRPDPPAPRFPGAGGLRPPTWRVAAMDCGKLGVLPLAVESGMGVCSPLPPFVPRRRKGGGTGGRAS
jgi:hypothetical protein